MKFHGEANLQQNFLRNAVIPLDEDFPTTPVVGQLVFTQGILYICVQIVDDLPYWVPLTQVITSFVHYQDSASASWEIEHNLNSSAVSVTVYDTMNRVVIPNDVTILNASNVQVDFGAPFQGSAVVLTGNPDGAVAPTYAFEFMQTSPSTTWTINHGLGRYPIVRVFVGNQEVQPASVVFTNINTVTLTFTTPQVGQAKLI